MIIKENINCYIIDFIEDCSSQEFQKRLKKLSTLLNWQGIRGHTSPHASKRKQWNDSSSVWRKVVNDSLFLYDFNSWQKTGLLVASWQIYHYLLALSWLNWGKKTQPVLKIQLPSGILVTISEVDVSKPFCDSSLYLYCSLVLN